MRFAPSGMYDDLSLDDLKRLAEERGIKEPGVGWPTCCPPNGNKPDIIKALTKPGGSGGGASAGPSRVPYDDLSLDDLKRLAEERGIKERGVGWPTCCPPNGNRPDIIKALDRLEQDLIGPMSKLSIVPQVSPRQTTWTAEEETCAHHHPAHMDEAGVHATCAGVPACVDVCVMCACVLPRVCLHAWMCVCDVCVRASTCVRACFHVCASACACSCSSSCI